MKCPYWRLMNLWHPQDFLSISDRRRPPARPHAGLLRAPDPSRRPFVRQRTGISPPKAYTLCWRGADRANAGDRVGTRDPTSSLQAQSRQRARRYAAHFNRRR